MPITYGIDDDKYVSSFFATLNQVYQPPKANTCGFSALIYVLKALGQLPSKWDVLSPDDLLQNVVEEALQYPSVVTHIGEIFCPDTFLEFIKFIAPSIKVHYKNWYPLYRDNLNNLEQAITEDIVTAIDNEGIVMIPFNVCSDGQPSPVPLEGRAHWCVVVGYGVGTPSGISFLVKQAGREYRVDAFDLIRSNAYMGHYPLNSAGTHMKENFKTSLPNGFHVEYRFTKDEAEEVMLLNKKMIYFFP